MHTTEITSRTVEAQFTAVMRTTIPVAGIGQWIGAAYDATSRAAIDSGATIVGPPFARYHRRSDNEFDIEAGFPVDRPITDKGDVGPSVLPGGQVVAAIHIGSYDEMEPTYDALYGWVRGHDAEPAGDPWEVYFTDPFAEPDPAMWRTEVVLPYQPAVKGERVQ